MALNGCENIQESLCPFLDGELSVEERGTVETHLSNCPQCRMELDLLRSASQSVQQLPRLKAPGSILDSVRKEIASSSPDAPGADSPEHRIIPAEEKFNKQGRSGRSPFSSATLAAMVVVGILVFLAVDPDPREASDISTPRAAKEAPAKSTAVGIESAKRAKETAADAPVYSRSSEIKAEEEAGGKGQSERYGRQENAVPVIEIKKESKQLSPMAPDTPADNSEGYDQARLQKKKKANYLDSPGKSAEPSGKLQPSSELDHISTPSSQVRTAEDGPKDKADQLSRERRQKDPTFKAFGLSEKKAADEKEDENPARPADNRDRRPLKEVDDELEGPVPDSPRGNETSAPHPQPPPASRPTPKTEAGPTSPQSATPAARKEASDSAGNYKPFAAEEKKAAEQSEASTNESGKQAASTTTKNIREPAKPSESTPIEPMDQTDNFVAPESKAEAAKAPNDAVQAGKRENEKGRELRSKAVGNVKRIEIRKEMLAHFRADLTKLAVSKGGRMVSPELEALKKDSKKDADGDSAKSALKESNMDAKPEPDLGIRVGNTSGEAVILQIPTDKLADFLALLATLQGQYGSGLPTEKALHDKQSGEKDKTIPGENANRLVKEKTETKSSAGEKKTRQSVGEALEVFDAETEKEAPPQPSKKSETPWAEINIVIVEIP